MPQITFEIKREFKKLNLEDLSVKVSEALKSIDNPHQEALMKRFVELYQNISTPGKPFEDKYYDEFWDLTRMFAGKFCISITNKSLAIGVLRKNNLAICQN